MVTIFNDFLLIFYHHQIHSKSYMFLYYVCNDWDEIGAMKKHLDIDHYIIAKRFEEEVNSTLKEVWKQLLKNA